MLMRRIASLGLFSAAPGIHAKRPLERRGIVASLNSGIEVAYVSRAPPPAQDNPLRHHITLAASSESQPGPMEELKGLWADAYDAWKNVPGHPSPVVYLMPESFGQTQHHPAAGGGWGGMPEVVQGKVLFGLTSWNPMGQDAPMEENMASYRKIRASLEALAPAHMWQSFGFDASGYRENGFTVAFPEERSAEARVKVVDVAKAYGQGAVYEFRVKEGDPSRVVRSTVASLVAGVDADVTMVVCPEPDLPTADPALYFE